MTELLVMLESVQAEEVETARTLVTSKPSATMWNIKRYTAFNTGGFGRTTPTLLTTFNPQSLHPNQDAALDFNLDCLRIGRRCSPCNILPRICEDDEHGEWIYFEMPPTLFNEFRAVVDRLPLGSSEDLVVKRIGWGGLTSQKVFDDKLPYHFPDGTMFGDSDPRRLIYYVKKRRDRKEESPLDETVTFLFDDEDRLLRIESQSKSIRSRP